ncbi:hypothetical protein FQN57_005244 [Myotisia sp. PD_48]|nr:hypothetical protein FQN57_005244 [Myotisia sp. PD_48]
MVCHQILYNIAEPSVHEETATLQNQSLEIVLGIGQYLSECGIDINIELVSTGRLSPMTLKSCYYALDGLKALSRNNEVDLDLVLFFHGDSAVHLRRNWFHLQILETHADKCNSDSILGCINGLRTRSKENITEITQFSEDSRRLTSLIERLIAWLNSVHLQHRIVATNKCESLHENTGIKFNIYPRLRTDGKRAPRKAAGD